jgi:hypothetical protein
VSDGIQTWVSVPNSSLDSFRGASFSPKNWQLENIDSTEQDYRFFVLKSSNIGSAPSIHAKKNLSRTTQDD